MKEGSICNKCNHRAYCDMSDEHNNDNATIKGCYLYSEQKAKTNADRIRSMTDEELLNWINGIPSACMDFDNESRCTLFDTCRECWLEWLKQECES